jgi:hypothetical protein
MHFKTYINEKVMKVYENLLTYKANGCNLKPQA